MGANGQLGKRSWNPMPSPYHVGDKFNDVQAPQKIYEVVAKLEGMDIVKIISQNRTSTPTSFDGVIALIQNTGNNKITTIAFYDKVSHRIYRSVDLEFDDTGNIIPYSSVIHKGKLRVYGSHTHTWYTDENGKFGRKTHDEHNTGELNAHDLRLARIIKKFNKHGK